MATITHKELYTHPGLIWLRCIELYEAWLPDDTVAWTSVSTSLTSSRRSITITLTGATDTHVYVLIDANTATGDCWHFASYFALPGMYQMPKGTAAVVGTRTVADVYEASIEACRTKMVEYWTNSSMISVGAITGYNYVEIDINSINRFRRYNRYGYIWIDCLIVCWYEETATVTVPGAQNLPNQPREGATSAVSSGGGGGSVDVSGIVSALLDIARRDVATSIDNGNVTVYNYSGDIVEPP